MDGLDGTSAWSRQHERQQIADEAAAACKTTDHCMSGLERVVGATVVGVALLAIADGLTGAALVRAVAATLKISMESARALLSLDPPFWWPARCLAVVGAVGGGGSALFGGVGVRGLFKWVRGRGLGRCGGSVERPLAAEGVGGAVRKRCGCSGELWDRP